MEIHKNFTELIIKYLPSTLMLPSFGNNDIKFHYQAPDEDEKHQYYSHIFNLWFERIPFNAKNLPL